MSSCSSGTKRDEAEGVAISLSRTPDARARGGVSLWIRLGWTRLLGAVLLGALGCWAQGQSQAGRSLEPVAGVVMDPSGAVVPGATVMLMAGENPSIEVSRTESGPAGGYRLRASPGIYTVVVAAKGFARFESALIRLGPVPEGTVGGTPAQVQMLDVRLKLETKVERIEVPGGFDRDSSHSGSVIVFGAREVEEMPLDPTALLNELQGLAGSPYADIFVDGFSGTKLPSRDSIREIRINQNPFSAENDTNPVNGVVQVSSKPGTNQTHGEAYLYGDDSSLNARNPFASNEPAYYAYGSGGALSGSLNSRASYYVGVDQIHQAIDSAVDAQTLDANLNQVPVSYAVSSPRTGVNVSPRLDLRAGPNSTLSLRYMFDRATQTNGGVGQLALASQGFNNTTVAQTLRISNTQTMGAKVVNETRFQYIRTRVARTPNSTDPTIVVEGALIDGGNDLGSFSDHQDRYEVQNYISLAEGRHYLRMGGRVRIGRDANHSEANYNGEFIFATLNAYQKTLQGMAAGHDIQTITAAGGGASQFNLTAGSPVASVTVADAGLFFQDDWKARQNLTLNYGLRFESQTYIADHADWAPRVGFSWGLGGGSKSGAKASGPRYMMHGGAGVFYRRFGSDSALQVERQNGVTQQEYVVESPQFCPTGAASGLSAMPTLLGCSGIPGVTGLAAQAAAPTVYRVGAGFRAPYFIGSSIGLDRRLGHYGTVGVTYLNNRGVHTQLTENVNAPMPGTYDPANPWSGVRPNGRNQNIYQYVSEGVYRSSQLSTNVSARTTRFSVYGSYVLRFDKSDAESDGGFPLNQYNLGGDYGRSLGDVRHTVTVSESVSLPYGISSWGYLKATSGAPFNILVGQDLNGDTQYNDRPAFATDLTRPSVVATQWGTFDTSPIAGQTIIPRNYGEGPGLFVVNLALGKRFGVGPALDAAAGTSGAKGPVMHKYTLEFWVETQNLLNHQNLMSPVGTLDSPLFGRSTGITGESSLSPDRVVDLQMSMRF